MRKQPFRIFWIAAGFLCMGLGTIGVILPILPTVPFYMGTVFCFAKSSKRLHRWFLGTRLYRRHLESFVNRRAMTWRTKLSIVGMVTAVMAVGFWMMQEVPVGRLFLALVWLGHLYYFFFRVKTCKQTDPFAGEGVADS